MESKSTLHRRYSVGTQPYDLILPKTFSFLPPFAAADTTPSSSSDLSSSPLLSFPSADLDLNSLGSQSYTSLKDILPTTSVVNSPTTTLPCSDAAYEIPIRHLLVKQAAWAYLQPTAASPTASTRPDYCHFLTPINALSRLFDCGLIPVLTQAFHRLLIHLRIRPSSSRW